MGGGALTVMDLALLVHASPPADWGLLGGAGSTAHSLWHSTVHRERLCQGPKFPVQCPHPCVTVTLSLRVDSLKGTRSLGGGGSQSLEGKPTKE